MSFDIQISDAERSYLDSLPLSRRAKDVVETFVTKFIANVSDHIRLDPARRLGPDNSCFRVRQIIHDYWGDRQTHTIDYYIDDEGAKYGVLVIGLCHFDS